MPLCGSVHYFMQPVPQAPAPTIPLAHPDMAQWRQRVQDWYPRWQKRTYFIPPVYMHRAQYQPTQAAGHNVHVTEPPVTTVPRGGIPKGVPPPLLESDTRDDQTQQRILQLLNGIAEAQNEVMFVLSQLQYGDYLSAVSYTHLTLPTS